MALKILCVDDEPDFESLIKMKFRKKIRDGEYELFFANQGVSALEVLRRNADLNLVLSDINMPVMDGLTLLAKIQELDNPLIKTVMVTAYGDMTNIRTAMNRGAFDFVTKPINFDDLEITINKSFEHIAQLQLALEEREKLSTIEKDLNVAKRIQQSLLPQKFPPFPERSDIDIYAAMIPARNVSGDLYDFFWLDKNRLAFLIGDVSGKGIPAAFFMAIARTIIKTTALKGLTTAQCMTEANDLICKESVDSMFITVFYAILDLQTGEFVYTNAGHTCPYLMLNDGSIKVLERTKDMVIGGLEDLTYHSKTLKINRGEGIFMFTDGVSEAMNPDNVQFTEERLEVFIQENIKLPLKELNNNLMVYLKDFTQDAEQSDDITVLMFRYL